MQTYEFTIILGGVNLDTQYEDAFFEAGCDDGMICLKGRTLYIEFMREAETAEAAISSAIKDVEAAGAYIVAFNEAGPVTISEAAHMSGMTRAALGQLESGKRGTGDFPHPVHVGVTSIWSWISVVRWLNKAGKIAKDKFEVAEYLESKGESLLVR